MKQIKIIGDNGWNWEGLENKVNEFIKDKDVINISYHSHIVVILFNQPTEEETCD